MKNTYVKAGFLLLLLALAAGAYTAQQRSLRGLAERLQSLENRLPQTPSFRSTPPPAPPRPDLEPSGDENHRRLMDVDEEAAWNRRLARLEEAVLNLTQATDYLMERGELPINESKMAELAARFGDATLSDRDRMNAFRLLRRNDGLTDGLVRQAVDWLQSSTNAGTRRNLLRQMDGLTNAALKQPLLGMLTTESSSNVREEIVENLQAYVDDPNVEAQLWNTLRTDPDGEVREEAMDALRRGPIDDVRLAGIQQRALQPDATLDEQLLAIGVSSRQDSAAASDFLGLMGEYARDADDPVLQARLFSAFDGADHPNLAGPLIDGLQSPHPEVREEAADALSGFVRPREGAPPPDPAIKEWLRYVAENDADPRVRREAFRALAGGRN